MADLRLLTHTLVLGGGKEIKIAYSTETEFLVQVSKGKGSYHNRYRIVGNFGQAVMLYNGINIAAPFNKRLLMPSSVKPVIVKQKGI